MKQIVGVDHISLAMPDLLAAIERMQKNIGFCLDEVHLTNGNGYGMKSAALRRGPITLVVTQGIGKSSQTSRYIENIGPGLHYIALQVDDLGQAIKAMQANGVEFSTPLLDSDALSQVFLNRDGATGLVVEFMERRDSDGFGDENVLRLLDALETQEIF